MIGDVICFALPDGLPLWVDSAVMERVGIVLGGGKPVAQDPNEPVDLLEAAGRRGGGRYGMYLAA